MSRNSARLPHASERRIPGVPLKVADTSKLLAGICPRCKRRSADGCDSWCPGVAAIPDTPGPGETIISRTDPTYIEPDEPKPTVVVPLARLTTDELSERGKRGAEGLRRTIAERKEAAVTQAVAEPASAIEVPAGMLLCRKCLVPQPADLDHFQRVKGGKMSDLCKVCRLAAMKLGQAAGKAWSAPVSPPEATVARARPTNHVEGVSGNPIVNKPLPAPPTASVPEALADLVLDADGWVPVPEPVLDTPPCLLLDLRAERVRVTAYLEQLDREIVEAEVAERIGAKTPEEIQALLEDAKRTARLCELALGRVA